jgi:hypothetical protein
MQRPFAKKTGAFFMGLVVAVQMQGNALRSQ